MLSHAVVLQHVEQGRLPGVVQAQEEEFAGLLPEAQVGQDVTEPIPEEHLGGEAWKLEMKIKYLLRRASTFSLYLYKSSPLRWPS